MKVNFDELEYNLYEILNIPETSTIAQIRSAYKELVLINHPDKNKKENQTEIFSNISLAYKVLKKEETKLKYDNYLKNKRSHSEVSHSNLKSFYQSNNNKHNNNNNYKHNSKESIDNAKKDFSCQMNKLNQKHDYIANFNTLNSNNANVELNLLQEKRKNLNVQHPQIFSNSKFNNQKFNQKFDAFKNGDDQLNFYNQEIIKTEENMIPSAYIPTNNSMTPFTDESYNDLYAEDKCVHGNNFTSLDLAFTLKDSNSNFNNKSLEERLKEREIADNSFKSMTINDFTEDTYNYGIHDKLK